MPSPDSLKQANKHAQANKRTRTKNLAGKRTPCRVRHEPPLWNATLHFFFLSLFFILMSILNFFHLWFPTSFVRRLIVLVTSAAAGVTGKEEEETNMEEEEEKG